MSHRRRQRKLSSRFAAVLARWRLRLAVRWHSANKGPWIVVIVLGLIVTGFGFALYSVLAYENRQRDLRCLALNVYFEARGEPAMGQYAVAEVTLNRVASGRYADSICDVVYEKNWDWLRKRYVGAFSWTEFDTRPSPKDKEWLRAWEVAEAVYYGRYTPQLNGALFYHSSSIKPSWAIDKKPVARIGQHVFYR